MLREEEDKNRHEDHDDVTSGLLVVMMTMSRPIAQKVCSNNFGDFEADDDEYDFDVDVANQMTSSPSQSDNDVCFAAEKCSSPSPIAASFGDPAVAVVMPKKSAPAISATLKNIDKSFIDRHRLPYFEARKEIHQGRFHRDDLSCSDPTWLPIYDLASETRETLEKLKTLTFSRPSRKEDIGTDSNCAHNLTHLVNARSSVDIGSKDVIVTSSMPKRFGRVVCISSLALPSSTSSSSSLLSGRCDFNNNVCSNKNANAFPKSLKMMKTSKNDNSNVDINVECNKTVNNIFVVNLKYGHKKRGLQEIFETKTFDNLAFEYL